MIELGADYAEINRIMFDTKSMGRLRVERDAIDSIEMYFDGRCALMTVTAEMQSMTTPDELEGITPIPRQISGVVVGVTLREKDGGKYKCSVRTHEPIDASAICARLGGGGHNRAAGCEITGGITAAKKAMLDAIAAEMGV
jgi:phosphoesterase RecJ-like protein